MPLEYFSPALIEETTIKVNEGGIQQRTDVLWFYLHIMTLHSAKKK